MNDFALVRFERLHSQDDAAIRLRYEARGEPVPSTLDVFDFWDEIVQELRCCLLSVDGARPLGYDESGGDGYVVHALMPCGDRDAQDFAVLLRRHTDGQGMGGSFEVLGTMSAQVARTRPSDASVLPALRKRRRRDDGMRTFLIQICGHAMFTLAVVACLMSGMEWLPMVACCTLAGGVFHTLADVQVDPNRGGDNLSYLLLGNSLFSLMMAMPIAFVLATT